MLLSVFGCPTKADTVGHRAPTLKNYHPGNENHAAVPIAVWTTPKKDQSRTQNSSLLSDHWLTYSSQLPFTIQINKECNRQQYIQCSFSKYVDVCVAFPACPELMGEGGVEVYIHIYIHIHIYNCAYTHMSPCTFDTYTNMLGAICSLSA